jgi:hypothetical protein
MSLQWHTDNINAWETFFRQSRELELVQHDGGAVPLPHKNHAGREWF